MPEIATHYVTLGLTPTAPVAVIRSAYKALALVHHPDKTLGLSSKKRASHAAIFHAVQEAYDVLGNVSLKAAYDAELEYHGNRVDEKHSTFHQQAQTRKASSFYPKRSYSIRLTTPEEKRAMKAKVEHDLAYFREQCAKRDADDALLDNDGLKYMLKTWVELAEEYQADTFLRAHCALQSQKYQGKIAKREKEREEWFEGMSKPKGASSRPASKPTRPASSSTPKKTTVTRIFSNASSSSNRCSATDAATAPFGKQAYEQSRAEVLRAEGFASHAHVRALERARKDAAAQARLDAKSADVRAEKEKHRLKTEANAMKQAELVARVRAKVVAAPSTTAGANRLADTRTECTTSEDPKANGTETIKADIKKICGKCGAEHASFAQWRKCNLQMSTQDHSCASQDDVSYIF